MKLNYHLEATRYNGTAWQKPTTRERAVSLMQRGKGMWRSRGFGIKAYYLSVTPKELAWESRRGATQFCVLVTR